MGGSRSILYTCAETNTRRLVDATSSCRRHQNAPSATCLCPLWPGCLSCDRLIFRCVGALGWENVSDTTLRTTHIYRVMTQWLHHYSHYSPLETFLGVYFCHICHCPSSE